MVQKSYRVLGADLALTRYTGVPGSLELSSADSWGSLDLSVVPGGQGGLRRQTGADANDLGTVEGRANLRQALVLRLLTPLGALAGLGHPGYGCRLVELIGRLNDQATRNLARLYTLQALADQPRVVQVLDLVVQPVQGQPEVIQIAFSVLPLDDDQPLALALEISL